MKYYDKCVNSFYRFWGPLAPAIVIGFMLDGAFVALMGVFE